MLMILIDGASTDCGERRKCWLQKKERNCRVLPCQIIAKIRNISTVFLILFDSLHAILVLDTLSFTLMNSQCCQIYELAFTLTTISNSPHSSAISNKCL